MSYNFIIHYCKGSLNPADGLSRHPNYMNEEYKPNIIIFWLIFTLENKIKKLVIGSFETHEQFDAEILKPSAVSLMQALSIQAII